jgi:hypothetical protein
MLKQFSALEKGGRMFVLMSDWKQKGKLYSMLCDIAKPGTLEQIIIKMEHNCVSDSRSYSNMNFVPISHEYVMVVRKDAAMIIPVAMTRKTEMDVRDCVSGTWRDLVAAILEEAHKPLALKEIYQRVDGIRNVHQTSTGEKRSARLCRRTHALDMWQRVFGQWRNTNTADAGEKEDK